MMVIVTCVSIFSQTALSWLIISVLHVRQVAGQGSNWTKPNHVDCQQVLLEEVYLCVSQHGIDFNVFLTMVSDSKTTKNTTSTILRADNSNISLDKDTICSSRQQVMSCILKAAQNLVSGASCERRDAATDQAVKKQDVTLKDAKFLIKEQLEAIVGQYDVFCAHPCRISLLDDMRACYSSHDLDPQLFMSTGDGGPVIGGTRIEVVKFCKNSDSIFRCLQKSRDDCQESQVVLGSIGLDLDLMNQGFQVLCDDTETYMKSLDCFESHTKEVEYCHSSKYRSILAMVGTARADNWSKEKYYQEVCGVILRHIQCDLDAWASKDDEDCNEKSLNLKRKLHCTLMPKPCWSTPNSSVADVCTSQQKSACVPLATHWILMFISVLFVHSFTFC